MRIALLYNERPSTVPAHLPDDMYEEYDAAETVEHIARALRKLDVRVEPISADHDLTAQLRDGRFTMAFNIAEGPVDLVGQARRCREALPVAACEMAGIPCTGSDMLTLALTLDKALARRVVSPEVPVAPAVLFDAQGFAESERALASLAFPVFVKPNDEGSSKGIHAHNIAHDAARALEVVLALRDTYQCPVRVEEFLPGTEVTVAITGNGRHARILGMMEVSPRHAGEPFVYSLEVKRNFRQCVTYHVPPRLPAHTIDEIASHALTAYHALGCRDIARMDFRLDAGGQPRFLECNALPGLNPEHSDIVILSRGVVPYDQLVQGILIDAAQRNGIAIPARKGVA